MNLSGASHIVCTQSNQAPLGVGVRLLRCVSKAFMIISMGGENQLLRYSAHECAWHIDVAIPMPN